MINWLKKFSFYLHIMRVVQYTRTESGRLFGKDDPSSGRRVMVFAEVKKQEIVSEVSGDCEGD